MEALIVGGILVVIQVLIGIVLNNFASTLKDLKLQDAELQRELTEVKINYVHKQDLRELKNEISEKFTDLKQWIKEELKENQ